MAPLSTLVVVASVVAGAGAARVPKTGCAETEVPFAASSRKKNTTTATYECVSFDAAVANATAFLTANMPPFDEPVTLFGLPGGVDGLDDGVASMGVNASVAAQQKYPWAADVPQGIFNEYVAAYAMTNEPRTYWRGFFAPLVDAVVANLTTQDEVIAALNGYGPDPSTSIFATLGITFKSSMTPLIFDPLSTVAFGYASCTGISAVFVAALRAAGVPARVAGTPAWNGDAANGNHNWAEVYRTKTQEWVFIEGHPSGGSETLDNPCDKWFCNANHFPASGDVPTTPVFAARFDGLRNDSSYPLAWDPLNLDVPGVNRTAYYLSACSVC